jgi:hypothetical protein
MPVETQAPQGSRSGDWFVRISHDDWKAAAIERYGDDVKGWRFRCPLCGFVARVQDWLDAKADDAIAFSCVGRWRENPRDAFMPKRSKKKGPCNYAGGGLFRLNPVIVTRADGVEVQTFDFADRPLVPPKPKKKRAKEKEATDAAPTQASSNDGP